MRARARALAAILGILLLGAACTSGPDASGGDVPTSPEVAPSPANGPGSALAAQRRLCTIPRPRTGGGSEVPPEGPTPPAIARVMEQVEQIRGFDFTERVVAEAVGPQAIADGFAKSLDASYPAELFERRSLAWQTIGVIAGGTSIRDELLEFGGTQVIGFYNTLTGELKFIGTDDPSPFDRVTLAHELTHAIDDQRFGLERLDFLGAACRDEELEAMIGLVEGNATYFMLRWAQTFLSPAEQVELSAEAAQQAAPGDLDPFVESTQAWPYTAGFRFVTALEQDGGNAAVDAALEDPPISTEQVMHPERYPNDVPVPVDVPDLAPALGQGWEDLDVQDVGEMWLDEALRLRLGDGESDTAAAGWDGGIYRAWSDRGRVAVVLATAWDSDRDAEEFAVAMRHWIEASGQAATVPPPDGSSVRVLFASDRGTLGALETAAG